MSPHDIFICASVLTAPCYLAFAPRCARAREARRIWLGKK